MKNVRDKTKRRINDDFGYTIRYKIFETISSIKPYRPEIHCADNIKDYIERIIKTPLDIIRHKNDKSFTESIYDD